MILIVKHIDIEGPGTFGEFLKSQGEAFQTIELGAGESIPADPRIFKAVVVLGGPMNVDEEVRYPFLKPENDFIQKVLKAEIPFLGICLGSQLLAKATGARVVKSPVEEIGWYHVQKCQLAKSDRLFDGFCEEVPVFQWHGDMFQVPLNGNLLATAEGCPNQALKIGDNAYGLQFHVEVTDKTIREWCEEYCETDLPGRLDHAQSMMDDYWKHKKVFDRQAKVLYQNFLKIIAAGGKD